MPRPAKKVKASREAESAIQDVTDQLVGKLDFHILVEKDPELSVSSDAELLQALAELRRKLVAVQQDVQLVGQKFADQSTKDADPRAPASYVEMKVQLLLSYLIALTYYLLLKIKGAPVRSHPVVPRLLWIRTLLEKLKPVDQRLQYQMNKLLQWHAKKAEDLEGLPDAQALRPGELTTTVQDEEVEKDEAQPTDAAGHLGAYKPPKIAQVEYTGDHVSMQEKAEKELERKKARLERSEFMRSLREEFTDAPKEVVAEELSARAQKAKRLLQEQQEFEEDTMQRVKVKKAELRRQKQTLRESRATSGGAVSLFDAAADFGDIMRSAASGRKGRGKGRGRGGVLQEYEDAKRNLRGVRENVASALDGARGRKRGGGQLKRKR
ncbi:unnamed protein product [Effrenium voratum]|nr:unnamed protein product [Effrenium voratum]